MFPGLPVPAGPYSDLTVLNAKGMPKLRKIAVLMTDGDYNINYCKGVEAKNSDQTPGHQLQLGERQVAGPGGQPVHGDQDRRAARSRCSRSASR